MKKAILFLILLAAMSVAGTAQTVGDAFYVYRNDGEFNAFLFSEVDSMAYSYEYLDGSVASEVVTQLIYTADSTYRIPLGSIDSISCVQHEPVLSKDVFPLTAEHASYIVTADTLNFTMRGDTPGNLRPKVGDIVVAAAECEAFPDGIVARVTAARLADDVWAYTCEPSSFDEVFDRIVFCAEVGESEAAGSKSFVEADPISFTKTLWNKSFSGSVAYSGTTTSFDATDRTSMKVTINKPHIFSPLEMTIELRNSIRSTIGFNAASEASITPAPVQIGSTLTIGRIPIPIPYVPNLLWLEPKLSLFGYFKEEGKVELDYSAHFNRDDVLSFTYRHGSWSYNYTPTTNIGTDVAKLSMEGSAEAGLIPKLFFSVNGTKAGFGANVQVALKEYVNFEFDATKFKDGGFYAAMKNSYCRTTVPCSVTLYANANIFAKYDSRNNDKGRGVVSKTFAWEPQWGSNKYMLPLFNNLNSSDGRSVSVQTARDILLPADIGVQLLDEDGNILNSQTSGNSTSNLNGKAFSFTFSNLEYGKKYYARPTVNMFGYTIPSDQKKELTPDKTSCPDGNHPHAIDLGLPSGTKWACCNVGASAPEVYGGYYAWGETEEKSVYDYTSYKYYNSETGYISLGSDIAGTGYDVAHVKWGGRWHMPTIDQCEELANNTSSKWTTKNGINGREFTGPNGGTIFMPAAGYRWNSDLYYRGYFGYCWSSTQDPDYADCACYLNFYSGGASWYHIYNYRHDGRSVRPVTE